MWKSATSTCLPDQRELNTYWQRVNEALVGHKARVVMDRRTIQLLAR